VFFFFPLAFVFALAFALGCIKGLFRLQITTDALCLIAASIGCALFVGSNLVNDRSKAFAALKKRFADRIRAKLRL